MKENQSVKFIGFLLFFILFSYKDPTYSQTVNKKEFRGVWIATINNIDWPSAPGLPAEQQKKELKNLIDRIAGYHLNAVFFQVRAAADAFYTSSTEPWSYFLSGKQGEAVQPFFDPLAYAIELCHSRGIELHAWFNPFRVRNLGRYELAKNSFAAKNPQFQHDYDSKRFFDPGYPQVRAHIIKVILEVVRNYDIDAVLLDDYFYPYPLKGRAFPDSKTFEKYGNEFYPKRLKDWRRNNINCFISQLHDSIKLIKPSLELGISPFGVWRTISEDPNGSPLLKGTTSYDDLYADVYKWLSNNWIDYVIPQLYWEQGNRYGDFNAMAKWWNDHSFGKPLYLGQALYRVTNSTSSWSNPKELSEQISLLRKYENIKGFAFFSASHLSRLPDRQKQELLSQLDVPQRDSIINKNSYIENTLLSHNLSAAPVIENNSFDSIIDLSGKKELEKKAIPFNFYLKKQGKNWILKWKNLSDSVKIGEKYVLLSYRPVKKTGYLRKIFYLDKKNQVLILKNNNYNPRKDLYRLVITNPKGKWVLSELIKIKRNRIVYP
jgi:uncharacterized lipoprotein YddW (UPF0748 family)